MVAQYVAMLPLILGVTAVTALLVALRANAMTTTYNAGSTSLVAGYVVGGLVFGAIAIFVYRLFTAWWPVTAASTYLWVALAFAVVLTVAALVMRLTVMADAPFLEWTLLNFGWALAYGLLLPRMLAAAA